MTGSSRPRTLHDPRKPATFRAFWPVVDDTRTYGALCREAALEVPLLAAQAKATLLAPGRFSIAAAEQVPGACGGISDTVLIFEAPARRRDPGKSAALSPLHFRAVS